MSSILKVDTIQDQNGNLIISKDSGGSGFLSPYASSSAAITYTVTVASKTSAHPYNGVGSSNGYFINGIESPIIEIKGNDTSKPYHYKFDQSDSSNSGHPLLFYNNVGKTTGFSTGVTTNGTPGQAGAYTMIAVDSQTPNILYYQCSSHANMGNHTFATSPVVNTGVFLTLPTADGSSGQVVTTNGSGVLSFANGSVPDDAITLAKMAPGTDGNIISYDTSGNPVAVATGNDGQVLTSAGAGAVPTFETLPAGGVDGIVSNANATAMTIDSSERVGIGTGSPSTTLDLVAQSTSTALNIRGNSSANKSRIEMGMNDNSAINLQIEANNDAANYIKVVPNQPLIFRTNNTDRVKIHSGGVMAAANGIALGVGTADTASNVLDDYEEGTWTLAVTGQGGDTGQVSRYTKIGNRVFIDAFYECDTNVSATDSSQPMQGLPFSAGTSTRAIINVQFIKTSAVDGYGGAPTLTASSAVGMETYGSNFIIKPISTTSTNTSLYYRQNIFQQGTLIRLSGVYETTA
jgi:hypothetical protein